MKTRRKTALAGGLRSHATPAVGAKFADLSRRMQQAHPAIVKLLMQVVDLLCVARAQRPHRVGVGMSRGAQIAQLTALLLQQLANLGAFLAVKLAALQTGDGACRRGSPHPGRPARARC